MAEPLSKEWFELQDIRNHNFSQDDWIPVYQSKIGWGMGYLPIGKHDEYKELRSFVVFEGMEAAYKKRLSTTIENEFFLLRSMDSDYPEFDITGEYIGGQKSLDYKAEKARLGFPLVYSYCLAESQRQQVANRKSLLRNGLLINQDFILSFRLIQDGLNWIASDKQSEIVIRITQGGEEGSLTEIKSIYLKKYLAARKANLRVCYYIQRGANLAEKPSFTIEPDRKETDLCVRNICNEILIRDNKLHTKTHSYLVGGSLWRGEWVCKTDELAVNAEDSSVWVKDKGYPAKKVKLELSEQFKGFIELQFKANILYDILRNSDASLCWFDRNESFICFGECYKIPFGIDKLGNIRVVFEYVARLPWKLKRKWESYSIEPTDIDYECYKIIGCHYAFRNGMRGKNAPEVRLLNAVENVSKAFAAKYNGLSLFKEDEKRLAAKLSRFYALDEEGLLYLAVDVNKYCIERLDKKVLSDRLAQLRKDVLSKDEKNLGSLKFLGKLLDSLNFDLEKDAKNRLIMLRPLFGLYDLRSLGGVVHIGSNDEAKIADAYKRIGINGDAPFIEQGAQLLENVAIAFEKISELLKSAPMHSS